MMLVLALLHALANTLSLEQDSFLFPETQTCLPSDSLQEMDAWASHSKALAALVPPKDRPESYRNLLFDGLNGLNRECRQTLDKIYKSGKDLAHEGVKDRIRSLSSWKVHSGRNNETFFHYYRFTRAFRRTLQKKRFDEIITYQRRANSKSWYHSFFVAEDPVSSRAFGDHLAMFKLAPGSRTINHDLGFFKQVVRDTIKRFPDLGSCGRWTWYTINMVGITDRWFHPLIYAILEDSGVEVVDFSGGRWFQILSSTAMVDVEMGYPNDIKQKYPH